MVSLPTGSPRAPVVPALAVVLATDCFATVAPVVSALRRQDERGRIELVLVAPPGGLADLDERNVAEFAAAAARRRGLDRRPCRRSRGWCPGGDGSARLHRRDPHVCPGRVGPRLAAGLRATMGGRGPPGGQCQSDRRGELGELSLGLRGVGPGPTRGRDPGPAHLQRRLSARDPPRVR